MAEMSYEEEIQEILIALLHPNSISRQEAYERIVEVNNKFKKGMR